MAGLTHNHAFLVEIGERWLRGSVGCQVVAAELTSMSGQTADVIGFKSMESYLIEVKVSRSDFHRDKKKPHQRDAERSMGNYRWYLTPPGLLSPADLPQGWGLLEPDSRGVKVIVGTLRPGKWLWDAEACTGTVKRPRAVAAYRFENPALGSERAVIFSIARRLQEQLSVSDAPSDETR